MNKSLKLGLSFLSIFVALNIISVVSGMTMLLIPVNFFGLLISTALGYDIMNSSTVFDWYFMIMIVSSAIFWYVIGWLIGFIIDAVERKK